MSRCEQEVKGEGSGDFGSKGRNSESDWQNNEEITLVFNRGDSTLRRHQL